MAKRKPTENLFLRVFHDMFTGRDNRSFDLGRILWFQSIQAFIGISIYSLYKGGTFDPVLWGAGLAALMASGGAALGMKQGTEPPHGDDDSSDGPQTGGLQTYVNVVNDVKGSVRSARDAAKPDTEDGPTTTP